jgi:ABC-2 type transport system permease protein
MVNMSSKLAIQFAGDGAAKFLRDTWLVFGRQLLLYRREPVRIVLSFAYPVTMLVIFAPMMTRALSAVGVTNYTQAYRIFVPGLVAYVVAFGGLATGFSLLADIKGGIVERTRVTPVSRVALILGRTLLDMVVVVFQAVVVTVLALPSGLRVRIPDLLVAYLLLAMLGLLTVSLSYALALRVRNSAALGPLMNSGAQPVMLISGMLLPLTLAPLWMIEIAWENPFYWGTNGVRALFADHLSDSTVWVSLLVVTALAALTMAWTTRLFTRTVR